MKFLAFFSLLLLTQVAFARQKYVGTFQTENLGFLALELEFGFTKGKTSSVVNSYYQEHIDNGQWGDWICENKATFKESLKITGTLSTSHGALIGKLKSDRYDLRKGFIIVSDVQQSGEEFNCELFSLKNKTSAYFEGYDAVVKAGKFTLVFMIRGSEIPVSQSEVGNFVYRLDAVDAEAIVKGSRYQVQWSVNVDHGSYSNNYEWGHVGLAKE